MRLDQTGRAPMTMRPDPTFHASPKLAMEAPPENFAYTLLLSPDFSKPALVGHRHGVDDLAVCRRAGLHVDHRERVGLVTVCIGKAPYSGGVRASTSPPKGQSAE